MSFDLQLGDRRALVTGGTKGIGAAVVETLRDAGTQVVATGHAPRLRDRPRVCTMSVGVYVDAFRASPRAAVI